MEQDIYSHGGFA